MDKQKVFRWILIFSASIGCALLFIPFLKEILLASFFAFALAPLMGRLTKKKLFHRRGWVAVTLIGLILAIVLPIGLLFYNVYALIMDMNSEGFQQSDLYADLLQTKNFAIEWANEILSTLNLAEKVDLRAFTNQLFSGIGSKVMAFSTNIAAQLPDVVLSLFIFCCALYLFLAEGKYIRQWMIKNRLLPATEMDQLVPSFQRACYSTLIGSIMVGAVQALSVMLGALVLGSKHLFLIFLVTFIFSFIPVLGAAPVGFFLALISAVKGNYAIAAGFVVVGIFSGTIDNIIRPWLVRGEQNINSIVMLFAIIGAIIILGLPGLFLGPMFVSAVVQIYSLYIFPGDKKLEIKGQDF
jgi:predicted PurR-regulated permease PerM